MPARMASDCLQPELLEAFRLFYDRDARVIICIDCGFALKTSTDRVSRHLGQRHKINRGSRRGLTGLLQALDLPDPSTIPPRENGSIAHPHLTIQTGLACRMCDLKSTSREVIAGPIAKEHTQAVKHSATPSDQDRGYIRDGVRFQS